MTGSSAPGRRADAGDRRLDTATLTWAAAVVVLLAIQPFRAVHGWYGTDWMSFATGARLLHDGAGASLYDAAAQLREQTALIGQPPVAGLDPYPLFPLFALVLQPLAALPPQLSAGIWAGLMAGCLVASALLMLDALPAGWTARRRVGIALGAVALLPMVDAVAWGQVTPLLLLLLVLAIRRAVRHGDDLACGLLLAGVGLKPQLVWLLAPLLVIAGARRVLAGFAAGVAVWIVSSLLIVGPAGMRTWIFELLPNQYAGQSVDGATVMSLLAAAGAPARVAFAASMLGVAAILWLAWRHRADLRSKLPMLVAGGVALSAALSPHAFARDLAFVGPALLLQAGNRARTVLALAITVGAAYIVDDRMGFWGQHLEALAELAALAAVVVRARAVPALGSIAQAPAPASA